MLSNPCKNFLPFNRLRFPLCGVSGYLPRLPCTQIDMGYDCIVSLGNRSSFLQLLDKKILGLLIISLLRFFYLIL